MPSLNTSETQLARSFRDHLPDLNQPRFTSAATQTPKEYARAFEKNRTPPWLHELVTHWRTLYQDPFKGITNDGQVIPNLYQHQDEGIDTTTAAGVAYQALSLCSDAQKRALCFTLDSRKRRMWTNPEFYLNQHGLRLEDVDGDLCRALLAIVATSLSSEGFEKALATMRINAFLGGLVNLPHIMNEDSYNFVLFGAPSATEPWAWCLYGHHLCLSVFFYGPQVVIAPCFTGAEPNLIDSGRHAGTRILEPEESLGLKLMQSLSPELRSKAQLYQGMQPPDLPTERWNKDDQRHLCGAARDNRVVTYEGVAASSLDSTQQQNVLDILEQFLLYHPKRSRDMKLEQSKKHFDQTHFCWIGGFGDDSPFYYRLQSPVILVEFDHHAGVFLTNDTPAKYHTHTILRMPNQGDYGYALTSEEQRKGL